MLQNKIQVSGIIVGLMLALSMVYLVETIEEFEENDTLKGIFFLGVTVTYMGLAIALVLPSKKIYLYITGIGSAFLFILYFATRESLDDIGELGMISKGIQICIIVFVIGMLKKY
jgi:hypothetical protein